MYICDECGMLTEELHRYVEFHPYGDFNIEESHVDYNCSCSGVFVDAYRCKNCGEYSPEYGLCPDCEED